MLLCNKALFGGSICLIISFYASGVESLGGTNLLNLLSPVNTSNNIERLTLEQRLIDRAAAGEVGETTQLIWLYYDDDNRRAYAWAKVLFWLDLVEKRPVRITDNGEILVQNARRRLIYYEEENDTNEIALMLDRLDNAALAIYKQIQAEKSVIPSIQIPKSEQEERAVSVRVYEESTPSDTVERMGGETPAVDAAHPGSVHTNKVSSEPPTPAP